MSIETISAFVLLSAAKGAAVTTTVATTTSAISATSLGTAAAATAGTAMAIKAITTPAVAKSVTATVLLGSKGTIAAESAKTAILSVLAKGTIATAAASTAINAKEPPIVVEGSITLASKVYGFFFKTNAPKEIVMPVVAAGTSGLVALGKEGLDRSGRNHQYELTQKWIERDRERASDLKMIQELEGGSCGNTEDLEFQQYWQGVWNRNPGDKIRLGGKFKQCLQNAPRW